MLMRLHPAALLCLLVELVGLAAARAQLLVVTSAQSESVSRTLRVDSSLAVSGAGLMLPGAINAAALVPLEGVAAATLSSSSANGSSTEISGSHVDFSGSSPHQIVRNGAGAGLGDARSVPSAASAISVSTAVPAITALGASQAVITSTTLRLDLLTVFP